MIYQKNTITTWILLTLLVISLFFNLVLTGRVVFQEKGPIKIGGAFALTGYAAEWGEADMNGATLAIEEVNAKGGIHERNVELIVEDIQSDGVKTVTAVNKLINFDSADMIIGPTWFGQVASPLAKQNKVLMISPSAGVVPEPNKYFFDVWPTERQEVLAIVDYMIDNKVKNVVVVYSLNDWSQSVKDNFVNEAQDNGLKIIDEFPTNPDEKDFRTIIAQIKKLNPEAVYAPFAFFPSQGAFSKQLKESGIEVKLYSSSGTENLALLEAFPEIEGTIYSYQAKSIKELSFSKRYEEKFKVSAIPASAYAYDSVYLIAEALESGAKTPEDISKYLSSINYNGVSSKISFDENGRITNKEYVIKIVKEGEFVWIEA